MAVAMRIERKMGRKFIFLKQKLYGCGGRLHVEGERERRLKDVSEDLGLNNWVESGANKTWEAQRGM